MNSRNVRYAGSASGNKFLAFPLTDKNILAMVAADEAILVEEAIGGLLRLTELYRDSISADLALIMSAQGE